MQFVTFRLGDALPPERIDEWRARRKIRLTHHPVPWNAEVEHLVRYIRRNPTGLPAGAFTLWECPRAAAMP